jgi:hypothetical protein
VIDLLKAPRVEIAALKPRYSEATTPARLVRARVAFHRLSPLGVFFELREVPDIAPTRRDRRDAFYRARASSPGKL